MKPRTAVLLLTAALAPAGVAADEGNLVFSFAWGGPFPITCSTPTPTSLFDFVNYVTTDETGNVYTSEQGTCYDGDRIQKFKGSGAFLTSWVTNTGTPTAPVYRIPVAVAVHPVSGGVYVAEGGNDKGVRIYSSAGQLLGSLGAVGTGDGQFRDPSGLVIAPDGSVFVSDLTTDRVLKFAPNHSFVGWAGKCTGGSNCDSANERSMGFACTTATCSGTGSGADPGQFSYPLHMAIGPSGDLYVGDLASHRIQKFDSSGIFLLQWGSFGFAEGNPEGDTVLNNPFGIAVAASGNVYVADEGNSRIVKYDADGNFLGWAGPCYGGPNCEIPGNRSKGFTCSAATCTAGGSGSWQGAFRNPRGVAFGPGGSLYVTDTGNSRVQVFAEPEDSIQGLIAAVQDLVAGGKLTQGQGKSLISKLQAALNQLANGNVTAAVTQLKAFVNEVKASIASGTLTAAEGLPLIGMANSLITALT